MGWKEWPYWVRGGILAIIFIIIIFFLSLLIGSSLVLNILFAFVPEIVFVGIAFGGLGFIPFILILIFDVLLYLIIFFIFGSILGYFYGEINYKKTFLLFCILIIFFFLYVVNYATQHPDYSTYSLEDCNAVLNNINIHFNKNDCYDDVSIKEEDTSICEKKEGDEEIWSCYRAIAEEKRDLNICDLIYQDRFRNECYRAVLNYDLLNKGNFNCEKVSNEYGRDLCYNSLAINKNDVNLCEKVLNNETYNDCIRSIAVNTKNIRNKKY